MKIKVHHNYAGICGSCRNASIAESAQGEFIVQCDWFGWRIPGPLATCSRYDDRRLPSLGEMRKTAWILQTDESRKAIGFVSNRKWRKSRKFDEEDYFVGEDD